MPHKDPEAKRAYMAVYARAYYISHKEAIDATNRDYRAADPEATAARRRAYRVANRDALNAKGRIYYAANKVARAAKRRVLYLNNRETVAEYARVYCATHPQFRSNVQHKRRATKNGNSDNCSVTNRDVNWMLKRQAECCFYCGARVPLTKDHVVAINRGGRHAIGNLVLACGPCNCSKGKRTVMEWKRSRGWLGQIPPFVGV